MAAESIEIHLGELAQIVESVFDTMMHLQVSESGQCQNTCVDLMTATIRLMGDWNGVLALECSRKQAHEFAARFLSVEKREVADDVVRDVLGELTNMIGGNLKSVFAGGLTLSMPTVVDGVHHNLPVCRARFAKRLSFQCDEGVFSVAVQRELRGVTLQ